MKGATPSKNKLTLTPPINAVTPMSDIGVIVFQRAVVDRRGAILEKNIKKKKKNFKKPLKIT